MKEFPTCRFLSTAFSQSDEDSAPSDLREQYNEFLNDRQNEKQSASINKTKQDVNVHQKKQEKKKKVSEIDEWVNTLESPWRELMLLWLEYKKARKDAYTAVSGVKMCLTKLKNMSGSDPRVAQEIIERSMANNWAGLFPLSGQSSRGHPVDVPARGQRIGQILQPETEEHRNEILERFRAGIKSESNPRYDGESNPGTMLITVEEFFDNVAYYF